MLVIAPSIIAADFARLGEESREAIDHGAEWLHVDVMDGRFVPNITIGPLVVRALKPLCESTGTVLDVHLMIEDPGDYVDAFAKAGADNLTVHVEACTHLHRVIHKIKDAGMRAGVALNPATPLESIGEVLLDVDLVTIMSVNPGFYGQKYIPSATSKISRTRQQLDAVGSNAYLQIDGGINRHTIADAVGAGATVAVAGSAVFSGGAIGDNIKALRQALVVRA